MDKNINGQYRYYAFISYKREDEEWAKWLQHKLEHYKLPSNLDGRTDLPKEIRPVFKDTSELTPGNLPEQISKALEQSKFLIVLCSPRSAQSEWVNKEVEAFKSLGKKENIIPFIIDGRPFSSNPEEECFPNAILSLPREQEILGANINEMGRDAAAVKVVACMFDIRFDELWQRYEREQRHRRNIVISVVAVFVMAVIGVAFWMYLQRQDTLRANWEMMENQARMVAEKSKEEVKKGNTYDAILALLEMLPEDGSRPFVSELDGALRTAYDSLLSKKWNNCYLEYDGYETIQFSGDGKFLICKNQTKIDVLRADNLVRYSSFKIPESLNLIPSFFSSGNDTIYFMDSLDVKLYHFPDGRFIRKVAYTENVLDLCMNHCGDIIGHQEWPWISQWRELVGIPSSSSLIDYNPVRRLALCGWVQKDAENVELSTYFLYDCVSKQIVKVINDKGKPFSLWDVTGITSTSFSPDGTYLAIAFRDGKGQIIGLNDFSTRLFDCGNGNDCAHYSNWLGFGQDGRLLHTSMFDCIKIYDAYSLSLADSISSWFSDAITAQMNLSGDICLVGDADTRTIWYRYKSEPLSTSGGDFIRIDNPQSYQVDTVINQRFHVVNEAGVLKVTDLKGEFKGWHRDDREIYLDVKGYLQGGKYMAVTMNGFRESQCGTDIVDVATGVTVCHTDPDFYVDCVYYNQKSGLISFGNKEGPDTSFLVRFPTFDHLVSLCREATRNMVLSSEARRKYYLSRIGKK